MEKNNRSTSLFILLGAMITGLGIGLAFGQPGFGLITGIGVSLLLWGLILAFKK